MRRLPGAVSVATACGCAAVIWALCGTLALSAQARPAEYQVKAAYLYNFARFVEWPAGTPSLQGAAFTICVLGPDPFGAYLDTLLNGAMIGGKPVVARRLASERDAIGCPVLFVAASEADHLPQVLAAVERGTLTVSDIPAFARRGGMIQFVADANRIRFEVNQATTERAGLTLSSELLKVAVAVRRTEGPGD
jgi:hypothetical protein